MALYKIVDKSEPILRRIAKPVAKVDERTQTLMDNMVETMDHAQGVGLAAPQVGISKRVIVVRIDDELYTLANPEIIATSGYQDGPEGCLSCPGMAGNVKRAYRIRLKALDRNDETVFIEAEDFLARAFQHEIDHLDGILFLDKATGVSFNDE